MSKTIKMNQPTKEITNAQQIVDAVRSQKRSFIPPKQKMTDSIENDTQYLIALQSFINEARKELPKLIQQKKMIEAYRLQVELLESIGKFQSNEGLVQDKINHYDNVFLVMYEKELSESREKFDEVYQKSLTIISNNEESNKEAQKIKEHIIKELKLYDDSEIKEHEEYRNYIYKILKRLNSKFDECNQKV